MLQELLPPRERPVPRFQSSRSQLTHRPGKHRTRTSLGTQRRHASHATRSVPTSSNQDQPEASTSASLSAKRCDVKYRINLLAQAPLDEFDLDAAWEAFDSASMDPVCLSNLNKDTLLQFSRNFCDKIEAFYDSESKSGHLKKWRDYFRILVERLQEGISSSLTSQQFNTLQTLAARSRALHDQAEAAIEILEGIRRTRREERRWLERHDPEIVSTYHSICASIFYYKDAIHVVDFLDQHFFYEYFRPPWCFFYRDPKTPLSIRNRHSRLLFILSTIRNPASLFRRNRGRHWYAIGDILILAYCEHKLPQLAYRVYEAMRRSKAPMNSLLKLRLVRALARGKHFDLACRVFDAVRPTAPEYIPTGIHLFALQGDAEGVYAYYRDKESKPNHHNNMVMTLFSWAIQGRTTKVRSVFDELYPKDSEGRYENFKPNVMDYGVAIFAHARRSDPKGIEYWLKRMSEDNIEPNLYIYSSIIQSYLQSGNLRAIADVLDQVRSSGLVPNAVVYTNIITALGRHHKPSTAEGIFKRALREGVQPDPTMVGALMNCYVEAGAWEEVVELFRSLESNTKSPLQLTIEIYNMVLKAYVLMGAPFRVVALLFEKLDNDPRVSPTNITFALLLQSACDTGYMHAAMEIFREMDRRAKKGARSLINPYVFTILMSGFLKKGNKDQAMAVYEEMLNRGIQPTSITFNTVLNYYSNERSGDSLRVAYEFMTRVAKMEKDASIMMEENAKQSPLQTVYEPVLRGYAASGNVEGFERVLDELLDAGGQLSIPVLTALLMLYRQKERLDSARKVWDHLFELGQEALQAASFAVEGQEDLTPHTDMLCIPLTTYLDMLSAAGEHDEVLQVWREYQQQGFSFNFFNWNRLGTYLIRAGEYERAFEVLDRIIIPYIRLVIDQSSHNPTKSSSSAGNTKAEEGEFKSPLDILNKTNLSFLKTAVVPNRPLRSSTRSKVIQRRTSFDPEDTATTSVALANVSASSPASHLPSSSSPSSIPEFVRPLRVLAQSRSGGGVPKPHYTLLQYLLIGYQRLRAGQPATQSVDPGSVDDLYYEDYLPEQHVRARQQLEYIHRQFPDAVRAVLDFQMQERNRLGENYEKVYIWG